MRDNQPFAFGISIHALREEGDEFAPTMVMWPPIFLSTPSARRATVLLRAGPDVVGISIHALREEGDALRQRDGRATDYISIHALREEGDPFPHRA